MSACCAIYGILSSLVGPVFAEQNTSIPKSNKVIVDLGVTFMAPNFTHSIVDSLSCTGTQWIGDKVIIN